MTQVPNPIIIAKYANLWPILQSKYAGAGPLTDCGNTAANFANGISSRQLYYGGTCSGQSGPSATMIGAGVAGQAGSLLSSATKLGSAVPVVGSIVESLASVFSAISAHHATAVANEQAAICYVVGQFNQYLPQIDNAVASGQITAQQGIDAVTQLCSALKQTLGPISGVGSGGHPCNAGCCFGLELDAHAEFVQHFYPDLSPIFHSPAPSAPNTNTLYGPVQSGGTSGLVLSTAPVGIVPDSNVGIGWGTIAVLIVGVFVVIFLLRS
jgi:hypothetical protein